MKGCRKVVALDRPKRELSLPLVLSDAPAGELWELGGGQDVAGRLEEAGLVQRVVALGHRTSERSQEAFERLIDSRDRSGLPTLVRVKAPR